MSSYKDPDHQQRQSTAAAAKKATLEKFRAASNDPAVADRHTTRGAVNEARLVRKAEREAAKVVREAELGRAAELVLQAQREAEKVEALIEAQNTERQALLKVEQKAARDARYAARKARKK